MGDAMSKPALSARAATGWRCSRISTVTRLRRIEVRDRIFFLTFNIARGVASLSESEMDVVLATLQELRGPNDFALYGYVVMPDHAHLLLHPKTVPLPKIMRDLKSKTGLALSKLGTAQAQSGNAVISISSAGELATSPTSSITSIRIRRPQPSSSAQKTGAGQATATTQDSAPFP
jgi:REP element-mobilizing transposase RayT